MIKERSGHTVMHSVREDNQHAEGVAIIKSKSSLMVGNGSRFIPLLVLGVVSFDIVILSFNHHDRVRSSPIE